MSTKHKYADLIKAWADGAEIQVLFTNPDVWMDCAGQYPGVPLWHKDKQYRIKPHPHQELIDAHAKGAKIQREWVFGEIVNNRYIPEWRDDPNPKWIWNVNYRIKPDKWAEVKEAYNAGRDVQWMGPHSLDWIKTNKQSGFLNFIDDGKHQYRIAPLRHQKWLDAFLSGKEIQFVYPSKDISEWKDVTQLDTNPENIIWNSYSTKFRIKPKAPHKHQQFIDAYKEGKTVQVYSRANHGWVNLTPTAHDVLEDNFYEDFKYRIHPHQEVMDAYNAGAFIQFKLPKEKDWFNSGYKADHGKELLQFHENYEYRVKPQPLVGTTRIMFYPADGIVLKNYGPRNIECTFDPDTHELLEVKKI